MGPNSKILHIWKVYYITLKIVKQDKWVKYSVSSILLLQVHYDQQQRTLTFLVYVTQNKKKQMSKSNVANARSVCTTIKEKKNHSSGLSILFKCTSTSLFTGGTFY